MQFALINSVMYVCDINMGYFDKHIIILYKYCLRNYICLLYTSDAADE